MAMIVESELDKLGALHYYLREAQFPDEPAELELWVGEWGSEGPDFDTVHVYGRVIGRYRQGWDWDIESDPFPQWGQVVLVIETDNYPLFYILREWYTEGGQARWTLELQRHICGDLEEQVLCDLGQGERQDG